MDDNTVDRRLIVFATASINNKVSREEIIKRISEAGHSEKHAHLAFNTALEIVSKANADAKKQTRIWGICVLAIGLVFIAVAAYLSSGTVPAFRAGRLLIAWLLGAGAIVYGLWMLATGRDTDVI